jgi:TetR/AcrR family transcriptional repressor of nem operon
MKVSRKQAEANRDRVIEIASEAFRAEGLDGVSIADMMKRAGLTHGGFYGNFTSKADLAAQAYRHARDRARDTWRRRAEARPDAPLNAVIEPYLSPAHRDHPERGCIHAALAADVGRGGDDGLRQAFTEGIGGMIDALTRAAGDGPDARRQAIARMSAMIGALVVSRAIADRDLSDEILTATRETLCGVRI